MIFMTCHVFMIIQNTIDMLAVGFALFAGGSAESLDKGCDVFMIFWWSMIYKG